MSPPPKDQFAHFGSGKANRRLFMTPEIDKIQEERKELLNNGTPPMSFFSSSQTKSSPLFKEMIADRFIPFRNTNTVSRQLFDIPEKPQPKVLKTGNNSNNQTPNRTLHQNSMNISSAERRGNPNAMMTEEPQSLPFTPEQQNQQIYNSLLEQNLLQENHYEFETGTLAENNENEDGTMMEGLPSNLGPAQNKLLTFHKLEPTNILASSGQQLGISSFDSIFSTMSTSIFSGGKPPRRVNHTPIKVLDAPELRDDFYLSLIDWSSSNVLAVSLADSIYLWQGETGKVETLCSIKDARASRDPKSGMLTEENPNPNDFYSAVQWNVDGLHLAAGTQAGLLTIWDASTRQRLFSSDKHKSRVGCLSWSPVHPNLILTGSRDATLQLWDFRTPDGISLEFKKPHRLEVCSVQWSPSDPNRFASGGNDNKLLVWNILKPETQELSLVGHKAAVKALAWSPHQSGVLVSGGGTRDTSIKVWNTVNGSLLNETVTGSQVCSLVFSKTVNEIATGLGFIDNQVVFWKVPSLTKVAVIESHVQRVLYLALSPNGKFLASGSGDQTVKIWDAFPEQKQTAMSSPLEFSNMQIR